MTEPEFTTIMPTEPPDELRSGVYDAILSQLCRDEDYVGLYNVFIERYGMGGGE